MKCAVNLDDGWKGTKDVLSHPRRGKFFEESNIHVHVAGKFYTNVNGGGNSYSTLPSEQCILQQCLCVF